MVDLIDLYQFASEQGVDVDWVPMEQALSLSIPLPDGTCCIALNPWRLDMVEKEAVCLAHELGHCELGAFYNQWAACDVRRKHENRADKWAIARLIPEEALDEAVADGHTELWDLAEHFGVTEDFMRKAICWYTHGNLAVDEYMSY